MSNHTPWTKEQAEQWAKEYAGKKWDFGGRETHQYYGFLDGLAKAAEMIEACPTVYGFPDGTTWTARVHSRTHQAKLVNVRPIKEEES